MLVEREDVLDELQALAAQGFDGHGRLVFLGGEAGVGKSALARELADRLAPRCLARWGNLDNLTTADPLAVFADALPELEFADAPDRLTLFRALRELLRRRPTLLVLEDLHWADEATLDALRFLGRRLDGLPVLILATYRQDDVSPRHRLSMVLGELAGLPAVRRIALEPLSGAGVAALVSQAGAEVDAAALHARTQGNPFFVTEVLAGGSAEVPVTVRDAVLTRVSRLTDAGARVASAAAILGTAPSLDLLAAVSGCALEAIDDCLDLGVLIAEPDGLRFRHELAREAVEDSLSSVLRRSLHQRALRALTEADPTDHRTLAHHAAGAGEVRLAYGHAVAAGARAAGLGAHREAAAQYRVALRVLPSGEVPAGQRAELFEALSYECYLTDQLPEAVAMRQRALELHELAGDPVRVGDCLRWLSRLSWFLTRTDEAERYGARAVRVLEGHGDGHELAMAYSNLSQLRMLAGDAVGAERWGDWALAVADRIGDVEVQIHALNNVGAAVSCAGRADEGGRLLRRSLELAVGLDAHEHVARAYTNLGSCAAMNRRYADSLVETQHGIAYCQERDLDSWVRYMQAWQVLALAETGRWPEAAAVADVLLKHPDLTPVSAIPAAAALARIEARRGLDVTARLGAVDAAAAASGELQRIAPVCCALAEAAWLAGRSDDLIAEVHAAWQLPARLDDAWVDGELRWWRQLGGADDEAPGTVPEPFALMLDRRFDEAAEHWDALGCVVWSAYCRGLSRDVATAQRGLAELAALGASASVEAVLRTRRERGLELPRRPRGAARERVGELTAREVEVLALLAEGMSTAEIAQRLVVSPRTVEHHVSAVLQKLGEPTRARAVASARRSGLVADR